MPRYFIEVFYKGTNYSGFQIQQNANSIQAEVEKALRIFFRQNFVLTGASRTDAGVHALQNYFHGDIKEPLSFDYDYLYSLNSILPLDIVIKRIIEVSPNAHCRFNAIEREYKYYIYQNKDPFNQDRAYYYPYRIDINKLKQAANEILKHQDFTSFSKLNSQVKNFICTINKSNWYIKDEMLIYQIAGNRFLRGMVRGLVGTMLRIACDKISEKDFCKIIEDKDCSKVDFSVPAHGLFLCSINYPDNFFKTKE